VIDGLVWVVIPELTDATVIVGSRLSASDAGIRGPLGAAAQHAQHVFCLLARKDVVLGRIMAETACVPPFAFSALQLDVAAVVFAPEGRPAAVLAVLYR
jgi:hypothetical protein